MDEFGDSDPASISPGATVEMGSWSDLKLRRRVISSPRGSYDADLRVVERVRIGSLCVQISFFGRREWASSSAVFWDMTDPVLVARRVEECQSRARRWGGRAVRRNEWRVPVAEEKQ